MLWTFFQYHDYCFCFTAFESIAICDEGLSWLDEHSDSELEEYKAKKTEYEGKLAPVMSSLYSQGEQSSMPTAHSDTNTSTPQNDDGPAIEEVD